MNKSYRSINIFVSHPFVPKNTTYNLKQFRSNIKRLIVKAGNIVKKEHQDFDIKIVFDFNDFHESLPHQIETSVRNSHFAIVDITENKANIFYEYGLLYGLNIPVLLIKARKSLKKFPLPGDIKNRLVFDYENFDELIKKCLENVANEFRKLLHFDSLANIYLNKIWFPNDVGTIHVVASTEPQKSEFAYPNSKNYIFLNNLEDIDSVLEVTNFLNRSFRNTKICIYSSDEFTKHLDENIVIIGGPGEDGDGNKICHMIMNQMNVKINYCFDNDDEAMIYRSRSYVAEYREDRVIKDYGYFARFPNPLNPRASIVLIHGIHTFGVLGAAKAFSDMPSAQGNIRKVMQKLNLNNIKQASFECFFPVHVYQETVKCPEVEENCILPLTKKK